MDKNGVRKRKPTRTSKLDECPWKIYASQSKKTGIWRVQVRNSEHNHQAHNPLVYHAVRNASNKIKADVIEKTRAMLTPAQILRDMKDDEGRNSITKKDIYNIRAELARSEDGSEFVALNDYLKSFGYIRRYHVIDDTIVNRFFVTHEKCIQRARRFPEVVIMDATYKTSLNKMPLVNIVGIDNLASNASTRSLRSFYIGSAVLKDESKASYTWVLEQLKNVVFGNGTVQPGIFVTDDDKALGSALVDVYPETPHTLCAWHILKNFDSHATGCFKRDSDTHEEYLDAVEKMIWGRTEDVFNEGEKAYIDLVSKTDKSKELKDYLALYV